MSFRAVYRGVCPVCGYAIKPGQMITVGDDGYVHAPECEERIDPTIVKNERHCDQCFLIHAGECS